MATDKPLAPMQIDNPRLFNTTMTKFNMQNVRLTAFSTHYHSILQCPINAAVACKSAP